MKISQEVFEQQCKRRFGTANPERMRMEYWEWMVRRGGDPFAVREGFGLGLADSSTLFGPDMFEFPDWCFERFGMSRTPMPDGRIICIAGEHEDYYDPDFCIYNDVIVLRPAAGETGVTMDSGEVEIYGYPESVFPPTDFHSATLVESTIFLIGRLGYAGTRIKGETPVFALDPVTYQISSVPTTGPCPGWIYGHHASYDSARHAITVRGGKIDVEGAKTETPHLAAHRLYLADRRWEVIAHKETHRRYLIQLAEEFNKELRDSTADAFRPKTIAYNWLMPEDHGAPIYGLDVHGVRVRFLVFYSEVRALVEGDLPSEVIDRLFNEIIGNLHRITGFTWKITEDSRIDLI